MTPHTDAPTRLPVLTRMRIIASLVEQARIDLANGVALGDVLPRLLEDRVSVGGSR